jgi:hypothetical protein
MSLVGEKRLHCNRDWHDERKHVAHRNVRRRSDAVGLILARTMITVAALLTAIPATPAAAARDDRDRRACGGRFAPSPEAHVAVIDEMIVGPLKEYALRATGYLYHRPHQKGPPSQVRR